MAIIFSTRLVFLRKELAGPRRCREHGGGYNSVDAKRSSTAEMTFVISPRTHERLEEVFYSS